MRIVDRAAATLFSIMMIGTFEFGDMHRALGAEPAAAPADIVRLPAIEDIDSMIAEVYCHPFADLGGSNFAGFLIPPEHFAEILKHFENCEPDHEFREDVDGAEIGTIRINLKGCGTVHCGCVRVCWFAKFSQGTLYFSWAGRRYRHKRDHYTGDETLMFDGFIRGLYATAHPETDPNREDK